MGWLFGGCCRIFGATVIALSLLATSTHGASAENAGEACVQASTAVQSDFRLPPGLLSSIALVESGRFDPQHRVFQPWPWSVDADGVGHFYPTKQEAIAATAKFEAQGMAFIDVGCMQIDLREHPSSFASLKAAFDPTANTAYAAKFLTQLYHHTGNWITAAAAYHSQTPGVADSYRQQVIAEWRMTGHQIALPATADVDPYHVLTVAFRHQLVEDARFRTKRNAAMIGHKNSALAAAARGIILSEEGDHAQ